MLLQISDGALYTVWGGSLAIGVVVAAVVAVLLAMIVRTAREIKSTTGKIWIDGQRTANATIHIPILVRVNRNLLGTLVHTASVIDHTNRIHVHAKDCPGCPHCLSHPGGGK